MARAAMPRAGRARRRSRDVASCAPPPQNVARAEARFPQPIEPFESPFAALLRG
jgi:hypothetical protein